MIGWWIQGLERRQKSWKKHGELRKQHLAWFKDLGLLYIYIIRIISKQVGGISISFFGRQSISGSARSVVTKRWVKRQTAPLPEEKMNSRFSMKVESKVMTMGTMRIKRGPNTKGIGTAFWYTNPSDRRRVINPRSSYMRNWDIAMIFLLVYTGTLSSRKNLLSQGCCSNRDAVWNVVSSSSMEYALCNQSDHWCLVRQRHWPQFFLDGK